MYKVSLCIIFILAEALNEAWLLSEYYSLKAFCRPQVAVG